MVEYFNTHIYAFWFAAGFALLGLELVVLGFSTGFVLFLGIGALITGGLIWFGIVPPTWLAGVTSFGLSSALITVLLYKPFKSLQSDRTVAPKDNSSDLIGYEFRLQSPISHLNSGTTRYSGITWIVELDKSSQENQLEAGALVNVVSVDAGKFRVISAEQV